MTNTYVAVACYLNDGSSRIFAVDSTDAAIAADPTFQALTDVITGNSLGDSAQGRTIVKVMATCENFVTSQGILFVDQQNNVVGSVGAINPEQQQPMWEPVAIPVQLNYTCKVLTKASVE